MTTERVHSFKPQSNCHQTARRHIPEGNRVYCLKSETIRHQILEYIELVCKQTSKLVYFIAYIDGVLLKLLHISVLKGH
jgi:hypothetical protein